MGYTWKLQLKIFKYQIGMCMLLSVGFSIFLSKPLPMIYGLVFGTLISILNFRLLAMTLEKAVCMSKHQAQIYAGTRYFIRFFINAVVLYIGIKAKYMSALGVIIGLVMIKIIILITNLFNNIDFFKRICIRKEGDE